MLNWNAPWPVMNDRSDSAGPTPTANGPWDVAAIFELQTRWWNQFLDASRGFWSLYGWTPPALSLTGDSSPSAETTETIVENVIEQGTPADAEAVLESQTRLWNHCLDANRSLWAMSPWTMPTAQWLAANAANSPIETEPVHRAAHHSAKRAVAKRSRPAAKAHKPATKRRASA